MDVEGFEKEVLMGALQTLKRCNYPNILFECWGEWKEREGVPAIKIKKELNYLMQTENVLRKAEINSLYMVKNWSPDKK